MLAHWQELKKLKFKVLILVHLYYKAKGFWFIYLFICFVFTGNYSQNMPVMKRVRQDTWYEGCGSGSSQNKQKHSAPQ